MDQPPDADLAGTTLSGAGADQTRTRHQSIEQTVDGGPLAGIRASAHGIAYQLKLLMLFAFRAWKFGVDQARDEEYTFSLGTEVIDADKFDDVVFSCHKPGDAGKQYRFLQAKHRQDDTKTINADELLSTSDGDFSILKYLVSYRKIKLNEKFDGEVKDFIICTNIDLDTKVLQSVEEIDSTDEMFGYSGFNAKRYKFKKQSDICNKLQTIFKENHRDRLVASVAKIMLSKKLHPDSLVLCYRGWLLDHVLQEATVDKKRSVIFQHKFSQGQFDGDAFLDSFRNALVSTYIATKKGKITDIENIMQQTVIPIPQSFNLDRKNALSLNVSDQEINEFLDKLVLAVKQPNEVELGNIVTAEIGDHMNLSFGKDISNGLLENMLKWVNEKSGRFRHKQDIDEIIGFLKQNFARSGLIGLSLSHKFKLEDKVKSYRFKDDVKVIETVKEVLGSERKQILAVYYKTQLLSDMKILQANANTRADEDIFCDLKSLRRLADTAACPVEAFRSEAYNHLVIRVDSVVMLTSAKNILQRLAETLYKRKDKKIILLISYEEQDESETILHELLRELSVDNEKYVSIVDDENNLTHLIDESKTKLLEESKVIFQGKEVKLCSILDDNMEFINGENLSKLISADVIEIGRAPIDDNYRKVQDHFVARSIKGGLVIQSIIKKESHDFLVAYDSQLAETDSETNKDIVLVSNEEEDFVKLCEQHKGTVVHWFKLKTHCICRYTGNVPDELRRVVTDQPTGAYAVHSDTDINLFSDNETDFIELCEQYPYKRVVWYQPHNDGYILRSSLDESNLLGVDNFRVRLYPCDKNDYSCIEPNITKTDDEKAIYFLSSYDELHWQKTRGTIAKLRDYIENFRSKHDFKQIMALPNKIIIIAAEPGAGKSTLLTHIAVNIEADPELGTRWVVNINLKNYLSHFLNLTTVSNKELVKFLYMAVFEKQKYDICEHVFIEADGKVSLTRDIADINQLSLLEIKLFTHFYNSGRVIVLLDGFDEISPECTKVVLDLIKTLKHTIVQKILVTTRPYNILKEIEDALGVFAYDIVPLNKDEQMNIITKLWKKGLKNGASDEEIDFFIKKFLDIYSQQIGYNDVSTIMSTPLHIKMVATVYEPEFNKYIRFGHENYDFSTLRLNFSLYNLYDSFINIKFSLIFDHTYSDLTHYRAMKRQREQSIEEHRYLALFELFTVDQLKGLLSEQKIDTVRDWMTAVKEAEVKIGLIDMVLDGKPHFIHRTFAEHFAADLLARLLDPRDANHNPLAVKFLYDILTKHDSQSWVLFKILNYKVVANCDSNDVLTAALNGDPQAIAGEDNEENSIRDCFGRSPLHLLCCNVIEEFIEFLFEIDEKHFLVKDNLFQWTPLHYAVLSSQQHNIDYQKIDIYIPPNIANERDIFGKTAVMLAIEVQNDILWLLTENGPDLDIMDDRGRTALHYAAEYSSEKYMRHLLKCGADPFSEDYEGKTVLHLIFQNRNIIMWKIYFEEFIEQKVEVKDLESHLSSIRRALYNIDDDFKVQLLCLNIDCTAFLVRNALIDESTQDSEGNTYSEYIRDDISYFLYNPSTAQTEVIPFDVII